LNAGSSSAVLLTSSCAIGPSAVSSGASVSRITAGRTVSGFISTAELDPAFKTLARERINGLVVLADATLYSLRHDIAARCLAMKLPSVWGGRGYLDAGGVASYQGDVRALYRRSTVLIDKVLKGTPPGEIPFEQGTKFELVINVRAAKAFGLTIPHRVRVSADAVIE